MITKSKAGQRISCSIQIWFRFKRVMENEMEGFNFRIEKEN